MRVVLYAEGPNETGFVESPSAHDRRVLSAEELGPGHVLTRRVIVHATGRDELPVRFAAPLLHRGRIATGSQLLDFHVLPRLLTWGEPKLAPDLVIVLVDSDGVTARRSQLRSIVDGMGSALPVVVAVAVQEFEAWCFADTKLWNRIVGSVVDQPGDPEKWKPGEAKQRFTSLISSSKAEQHAVRLQLAQEIDLDSIERTCSSFRQFLDDLKHANKAIA